MSTRGTIIALGGLVALAGCGRSDNASTTAQSGAPADNALVAANEATPAPVATSAAQTFANTAAASDAFEIATSRLAVDKAASASVKSFARKMIEAHTASTEKLKTAAAAATPAVTPDPTLTPEQKAVVDQLGTLSGAAFDRAYVAGQTEGHQKTLDALRAYAADGDAPSLKSFAAAMVPTVTAHLNMAKGLKV